MRFANKVVFITGGARGLGKAMAKAFLDEGASVAVNGRNSEALAKFEEEFAGRPVLTFKADVAAYDEMEQTAAGVFEKWGRVDVLVHNAGVVNPLAPAEKIKKEDFDRTVEINLKGSFYTAQVFGKRMMAQGGGRIVNISSQISLFGEKGFLPYTVTKAAVNALTRSLSYEWSKYGITVCGLAPGFIAGGMNEGLIRKQAFADYLSARTPVGRMASVDEVVGAVLFLASPAAAYINGETIVMDGGLTGFVQEPLVDVLFKGK